MQQQFERFRQYLTTEKRYSAHTIRAYIDDVQQGLIYLNKQFEIDELSQIKSTFIRTWLSSLKDADVSSKTINRKISSFKTFFKFLLKIGAMQQSPMVNITTPKIAKRLPQYVASEDIGHLLFNMPIGNDFNAVLERTILFTFYYTGMRLSELQTLKLSDVNVYSNTLKVLGKGNKERVIPMSAELKQQIDTYTTQRNNLNVEAVMPDLLFVNKKGKALYARLIYKIVNDNLKQVTTIEKKSPHVLRHSVATHLTNNGAELNAVKELLGHASLAATQIYTHNSIEKLKNAHKKAHPKA